MAYGDTLRATDWTGGDVAGLIENAWTNTGPAVFSNWAPTLGVSGTTFTGTQNTEYAREIRMGDLLICTAYFRGGNTSGAADYFTVTAPANLATDSLRGKYIGFAQVSTNGVNYAAWVTAPAGSATDVMEIYRYPDTANTFAGGTFTRLSMTVIAELD